MWLLSTVSEQHIVHAYEISKEDSPEDIMITQVYSCPSESGLVDFAWISGGIYIALTEDRMVMTGLGGKRADFKYQGLSCLSVGPERKDILTGTEDGNVFLWNTKLAKILVKLKTGGESAVTCLDWMSGSMSLNGLSSASHGHAQNQQAPPSIERSVIVVGCENGKLSVFQNLQPLPVSGIPSSTTAITALAFSSKGRVLVVGDAGGIVRGYDVSCWSDTHPGHAQHSTHPSSHPRELFKLSLGSEVIGLHVHVSSVFCCTSNGEVVCLNVKDGAPVSKSWIGSKIKNSSYQNGLFAFGLSEGGVLVYDVSNNRLGTLLAEIPMHGQTRAYLWSKPAPVASSVSNANNQSSVSSVVQSLTQSQNTMLGQKVQPQQQRHLPEFNSPVKRRSASNESLLLQSAIEQPSFQEPVEDENIRFSLNTVVKVDVLPPAVLAPAVQTASSDLKLPQSPDVPPLPSKAPKLFTDAESQTTIEHSGKITDPAVMTGMYRLHENMQDNQVDLISRITTLEMQLQTMQEAIGWLVRNERAKRLPE